MGSPSKFHDDPGNLHLELYGSQPAGTAPGSIGAGRYGGKLTLP